MKVLYVGFKVSIIKSGADQVNFRNQYLLETLFPNNIDYCFDSSTSFLSKFTFGVSDSLLKKIIKRLDTNEYGYVFISQSLLGKVAEFVKKNYPQVVIITFFHNVEIQYALEYRKIHKYRALPFYYAVKLFEKKACLYSDKLITLNKRDSSLMNKIYGCKPSLELPTSFKDSFDFERYNMFSSLNNTESIDYLFVGVSFFANINAVQWFIDNVMPAVKGNFYVIGKGMDKVRFNNVSERVHVYGFVEDLSEYYYRSRLVVLPVFVGGGMKTKTAEALMFGKTILGTNEAFEGYDIDDRCMILCNTAQDYIDYINTNFEKFKVFNEKSRKVFLSKYSIEVSLNTMREFFEM